MRFEISPVIAAVRSAEEYAAALESGAETVFVVKSDLLSLREMLAEKRGKQVFVHADTCEGLGKDKVGLEVLSRLGADGVISTKNSLIAAAKGLGLGTVQRFFLIDSLSVPDRVRERVRLPSRLRGTDARRPMQRDRALSRADAAVQRQDYRGRAYREQIRRDRRAFRGARRRFRPADKNYGIYNNLIIIKTKRRLFCLGAPKQKQI